MPTMFLRFDERLNIFLSRERRGRWSDVTLNDSAALKDVVESLGVPHTEVGSLLADGMPVRLADHARHGLRLDVTAAASVGSVQAHHAPSLQPVPPRPLRFVLDVHLGRLAAYLRMLGLDTWYQTAADDDALAALSARDERVLLSRDVGLLKRGNVRYGGFVYAISPQEQLAQILARFIRREDLAPFTRCIRCNGSLALVPKSEVAHMLPERVRVAYEDFYRCGDCSQVYWQGSHFQHMQSVIARVLGPR